jgi:hypothetical protein
MERTFWQPGFFLDGLMHKDARCVSRLFSLMDFAQYCCKEIPDKAKPVVRRGRKAAGLAV